MKDIKVDSTSAYGKGSSHSRQWWRRYIRQAATAGYIRTVIKTASFGSSTGVHALLTVTSRAREAISCDTSILLSSNNAAYPNSGQKPLVKKGKEKDVTWYPL